MQRIFFISGIIPGDRGFVKIWGCVKIWGFLPRGLGIFSYLDIFIPGIGDFFKSGEFYPRDFWGWGFFSWDGKSHQKAISGCE